MARRDTQAETFVDDTAVYRRLGDEAADYGITGDTIKAQISGLAAELLAPHGRYQKFVTFPDGSCVAQVKNTRRWEVWG